MEHIILNDKFTSIDKLLTYLIKSKYKGKKYIGSINNNLELDGIYYEINKDNILIDRYWYIKNINITFYSLDYSSIFYDNGNIIPLGMYGTRNLKLNINKKINILLDELSCDLNFLLNIKQYIC